MYSWSPCSSAPWMAGALIRKKSSCCHLVRVMVRVGVGVRVRVRAEVGVGVRVRVRIRLRGSHSARAPL